MKSTGKKKPTGPWRKVAHIEINEGAKGGRYYGLTLECGHYTTVTIRPFNPSRILMPGYKVQLAPQRCRCWHCGLRERDKYNPI